MATYIVPCTDPECGMGGTVKHSHPADAPDHAPGTCLPMCAACDAILRAGSVELVPVAMSAVLWDRAVDSIGQDYGREYGRFGGGWTWVRAGFGKRATMAMPRPVATGVLRYLESIASLDGSGMDPDGAAETRREAEAARRAVAALRRELVA